MQDPIPTFSHLISTLLEAHPELAYIHVVEPRISGADDRTGHIPASETNDFIRDIVRQKGKGTKMISAGGYTRELAIEAADANGDLIGYARLFLSNVGHLNLIYLAEMLTMRLLWIARLTISLEKGYTTE